MPRKALDPKDKAQRIKLLKLLRDMFDLGDTVEITTKMLGFLPLTVFLVGILKLGEVLDALGGHLTEDVLKKIYMDSNLCHQIIKKIDEEIKKLGG